MSLKPTRESLIIEAWYRGNLSFLWHKGQKVMENTWANAKNQLFVMNVARQYGKSYYTVSKAIQLAMTKPNARIKYGTAFHTDLTEFILPTFEKILESCPTSLKPKYKTQGSKWVFDNGSEIKLVGLDKSPNSLRGNVIDMIIIDEAGFVSNLDYIYKSVIIPATLHRPDCKIVFISTPPSTPAHAFLDYAQRADREGSYVKLTILDNPLINEDDIERMAKELGGRESTSFRRECLCEFVTDTDSAIIPEWKDEYCVDIPKDEYYGYYHKYVGMDLGVKDFTACIFGYYDFKKASLIIEDEFTMNGPSMNTELLVNAIRSKESILWGEGDNKEVPSTVPFRRISDNNNPHLLQDFSYLHNLTFVATNKDTLEAMINEVRLLVQSGRIIINPKCLQLLGCLKYGVWDTKKKAFARSTVYGHFDHLAALIYLVRNLAQHSNPIPADHGFTNHKAWLGNIKDKNQSHNAKTFANLLNPKGKDR